MSALAHQYQTENELQSARPALPHRVRTSSHARSKAPSFRKLPAFPGEELFFEAKPIDNSMVVRAHDPGEQKSSWRAAGAVLTGALIFTGLLLPGAYRMVAGMQVHQLRDEQDQLRREIAELRALEARHTNLKKLEEVAKNQDLIDPAPEMVQHLTPKGSYAMNDLPSGK
jgi:hypothetical protein